MGTCNFCVTSIINQRIVPQILEVALAMVLLQMFSKETWFDDKLIPIAKRELAEAYELTDDQLDVLAHDLLKSQHEHFHQHQLQQQQQNLAAVAGQQMRMSGSNANIQHMAPAGMMTY